MTMTKTGVCSGEGEAPKAEKAFAKTSETQGCCHGSCGTDPQSKMADAAASANPKPPKTEKDI